MTRWTGRLVVDNGDTPNERGIYVYRFFPFLSNRTTRINTIRSARYDILLLCRRTRSKFVNEILTFYSDFFNNLFDKPFTGDRFFDHPSLTVNKYRKTRHFFFFTNTMTTKRLRGVHIAAFFFVMGIKYLNEINRPSCISIVAICTRLAWALVFSCHGSDTETLRDPTMSVIYWFYIRDPVHRIDFSNTPIITSQINELFENANVARPQWITDDRSVNGSEISPYFYHNVYFMAKTNF